MIDDVAENIRNEQHGDAVGSVHDVVECADQKCENSAKWKTIKESDDWQVSNDPQLPLLCPSCSERTPDETRTPTEVRHEFNQELGKYSRPAWTRGYQEGSQ